LNGRFSSGATLAITAKRGFLKSHLPLARLVGGPFCIQKTFSELLADKQSLDASTLLPIPLKETVWIRAFCGAAVVAIAYTPQNPNYSAVSRTNGHGCLAVFTPSIALFV